MDNSFKVIASKLFCEIKKDILFFGGCGAFTGYFLLIHTRLKEHGITSGEPWGNSLLSDFISFNAFGLVFIGLIFVGAISTIAQHLGADWPKLDAAIVHLENRLAQIASSIISFTFGLSALSLAHSFFTISPDGIKLIPFILFFNAILFIGFSTAVIVARRNPPFEKWWTALLILLFAVWALSYIIITGTKK